MDALSGSPPAHLMHLMLCRSKLLHPALTPIFATVPLLATMYHTVIAAHRAFGAAEDASAVWFGIHLCVSQVRATGSLVAPPWAAATSLCHGGARG